MSVDSTQSTAAIVDTTAGRSGLKRRLGVVVGAFLAFLMLGGGAYAAAGGQLSGGGAAAATLASGVATTTTLDCSPDDLKLNQSTTCVATVTAAPGSSTPLG